MSQGADARSAVREEPLKLDAFHPSLRVMNWADEPATEAQLNFLRRLGYQPLRPLTTGRAALLICNFEEHPQRGQASAENGVREITKRQAYLLQHAVEEARRAVQGATKDETVKLQHLLAVAMGKRQDFWTDTCRDPPQMLDCSVQALDLFMRYGCRFFVPSGEQVQEILTALDLIMPSWDRLQPELFYQTMELNFPELDRLDV
jgi:hypothetical protein